MTDNKTLSRTSLFFLVLTTLAADSPTFQESTVPNIVSTDDVIQADTPIKVSTPADVTVNKVMETQTVNINSTSVSNEKTTAINGTNNGTNTTINVTDNVANATVNINDTISNTTDTVFNNITDKAVNVTYSNVIDKASNVTENDESDKVNVVSTKELKEKPPFNVSKLFPTQPPAEQHKQENKHKIKTDVLKKDKIVVVSDNTKKHKIGEGKSTHKDVVKKTKTDDDKANLIVNFDLPVEKDDFDSEEKNKSSSEAHSVNATDFQQGNTANMMTIGTENSSSRKSGRSGLTNGTVIKLNINIVNITTNSTTNISNIKNTKDVKSVNATIIISPAVHRNDSKTASNIN